MREAALRMLALFVNRGRTNHLERLEMVRTIVAAYPDIDPATPDFHVYMYFNHRELDYGGAAWEVRGLWLRGGRLELTTGRGLTDGMSGSDFHEDPTEDITAWLAALESPAEGMMGPFVR